LRPPGFRGLAEEDEDDDEDCCIQDNMAPPSIQRVQHQQAAPVASVLHLNSNPLITSMYPNSATSTITSDYHFSILVSPLKKTKIHVDLDSIVDLHLIIIYQNFFTDSGNWLPNYVISQFTLQSNDIFPPETLFLSFTLI